MHVLGTCILCLVEKEEIVFSKCRFLNVREKTTKFPVSSATMKDTCTHEGYEPPTKQTNTPASPPSLNLNLPTTTVIMHIALCIKYLAQKS